MTAPEHPGTAEARTATAGEQLLGRELVTRPLIAGTFAYVPGQFEARPIPDRPGDVVLGYVDPGGRAVLGVARRDPVAGHWTYWPQWHATAMNGRQRAAEGAHYVLGRVVAQVCAAAVEEAGP